MFSPEDNAESWIAGHRMSGTRHRDEFEPVPMIDIAPFAAGETSERARVVDAVRAACEEIGFFVITGHGFPEALATRIYDASRAFFDLPAEEKNAIGETGPVLGGLMHFAFAHEALAATLGNAAIGDLKETLDYGPGFVGDSWPAKDRQNNPPICVVGGVAVRSRKCGGCRVRCRCERRRFAVEVTRFGAAGNDGSVSGRGWAGGQQVRRSVAAARRWPRSQDSRDSAMPAGRG